MIKQFVKAWDVGVEILLPQLLRLKAEKHFLVLTKLYIKWCFEKIQNSLLDEIWEYTTIKFDILLANI